MGAGGVIQQHGAALVETVLKPIFYNGLSDTDKDRVEAIHVKPFLERTQHDVNFLLDKINESCRR